MSAVQNKYACAACGGTGEEPEAQPFYKQRVEMALIYAEGGAFRAAAARLRAAAEQIEAMADMKDAAREELGLERAQFVDLEVARRIHREWKASRLSNVVDQGDDVLKGKGPKCILAVRLRLLAQKLRHYLVGVPAGTDTVHGADQKGDGHA